MTKTQGPAPPQSCANCEFFLQTSNRGRLPTAQHPEGVQKIGYCRANPPTPYFEIDTSQPQDEFGNWPVVPKIGRFPVVLNNMWCGMFNYKMAVKDGAAPIAGLPEQRGVA